MKKYLAPKVVKNNLKQKKVIKKASKKNVKPASKMQKVMKHLKEKGSITSWEAIKLYKETRLAARIHVLIHKKQWPITKKTYVSKEKMGYVRYFLSK